MHIRLTGATFAVVSCLGLRSLQAQEPPARLPAVESSAYDFKVVGVIVPSDSGRRIRVSHPAVPSTAGSRSAQPRGFRDAHGVAYGRQLKGLYALEEKGIEWVTEAVLEKRGNAALSSTSGFVNAASQTASGSDPRYTHCEWSLTPIAPK